MTERNGSDDDYDAGVPPAGEDDEPIDEEQLAAILSEHGAELVMDDDGDGDEYDDDDGGDGDAAASASGGGNNDTEDDSSAVLLRSTEPTYAVAYANGLIIAGCGDDRGRAWRWPPTAASSASPPTAAGAAAMSPSADSTGDAGEATVNTGEANALLEIEATDSVAAVAIGARYVASGALDSLINVVDPSQPTRMITVDGPSEGIEWLQWHPTGPVLLAGCGDGTAWMWHVSAESGARTMTVFGGHGGAVTAGRFTPNGKTVLTGAEDGVLRVWQLRDGSVVGTLEKRSHHTFHDGGVTITSIVCVDDERVVSCGSDGSVRLSKLPIAAGDGGAAAGSDGRVLGSLGDHGVSVESVALSSAAASASVQLAVTACVDGNARVWDIARLTLRHTLEHGVDNSVVRVAIHPSQPLTLTAALDGRLRLWDLRQGGAPVRILRGHRDAILDMSDIGVDGFVATASDDGTVRVWHI